MQNYLLRLAFKPLIWELIIAIDSSKLYFADQIFAIQGQNRKSKFTIIYPATIMVVKYPSLLLVGNQM